MSEKGIKAKIAIAQINPVLGKLKGNTDKIIEYISRAEANGADLIIFPELSISGYLPLDLLFDEVFITANETEVQRIAERMGQKIHVLLGHVRKNTAGQLENCAVHLYRKAVIDTVPKTLLPTYDVFDEQRYFLSGRNPGPVEMEIRGRKLRVGIEICEDLWDADYDIKVTDELAAKAADIIINISASPFSIGKSLSRYRLVREKCRKFNIPFIYNNLVGAQDELIYDGNSFICDAEGRPVMQLAAFREELCYYEVTDALFKIDRWHGKQGHSSSEMGEAAAEKVFKIGSAMEDMLQALSLGISDYFSKSGFREAILGLSGGIDSAVVAVLASEALGPEHVYAYSLPSRFSSDHSRDDAAELSHNLGINYSLIQIHRIYSEFMNDLGPLFGDLPFGLAEENLQARIRGTLLMSLANKFNRLVLSTANKTESALGYSTLYGDMAGALAPVSDLNKLEVYALAEHINKRTGSEIIPVNIIEKVPSAELAADQVDPFDYEIVSPLVEEILENRRSFTELINMGYEAGLVRRIMTLIRNSEYKRKQASPGLRVSEKAFGPGRRMPIVNHFLDIK